MTIDGNRINIQLHGCAIRSAYVQAVVKKCDECGRVADGLEMDDSEGEYGPMVFCWTCLDQVRKPTPPITCRECKHIRDDLFATTPHIVGCFIHETAIDPYALRRPGDCGFEKKEDE